MKKFFTKTVLSTAIILSLIINTAWSQTTSISGVVKDGGNSETLAGVNIVVKGKVIGTITDANGAFSLTVNSAPPMTITASFIGFMTKEIEITDANTTGLEISLEEQSLLGQEVVVSASRVEESILESPVSIEKMGLLELQNTSSDDYYKAIANLKGVDVSASSINFQIINARGFNSTGNTRFVQLIDGMDTQAPALNFPIGSLNGPTALDIESVELIPGAASALYGPNAFNGILLMNSKSPFDYQGVSASVKMGMNHLSDSDLNTEGAGEIGPGGSEMMKEFALRYAKAFNNRFAFKINLSYSDAEDWYGTDQRDKNANLKPGELSLNPGSNIVHAYGDEVSANMGLIKIAAGSALSAQPFGYLVDNFFPSETVSRTPYAESDIVDYGAKNFKVSTGLHYRLTDALELSYGFNYGSGTTVYTGAQRYSLSNFNIKSHKLELKADNFYVRAYTTIEDSGDSYIADLAGVLVNDSWKSNGAWFGEYAGGYLGFLAGVDAAAGSPTPLWNSATDTAPAAGVRDAAHAFGRQTADTGRLIPGTAAFDQALATATGSVIPQGALFDDQTKFYHVEGMYDFKNQIDFMGLQVGASYKLYDLGSNGTVFADTVGNEITIQEIGAFAQMSKRLMNDKLKLTGSVRWDKNENFDSQINPRLSAVYKVKDNHNIRVSYQTGFRNPTTQGQHIDLNVVTARLLGGLPQYAEAYNIYENAYTARSVNDYVAAVAADPLGAAALGSPANLALLDPATELETVKPEQVQSIEIGYKGLIANKLFMDFAYYRNSYDDFIAQIQIRKSAGVMDLGATTITEQNIRNGQTLLSPSSAPENTFQTYSNINKNVTSQGMAVGLDYKLPKGYALGFNYNWNKLNEDLSTEGFLNEFNTPENKVNFSVSNRKVTDKIGFNVSLRWQDAFLWEASFAQGEVPAVTTVDAQVSYRMESLKSILKIGGSNLANKGYTLSYGGPSIGAIYYVSVTFDEFFN
jgi:outer membrane receptor protein involved in Fe transport